MKLLNARGQSTAEYAVVIAIVLGAVVGMQTYVKRGMQAKFKISTEKLTDVKTAAGNADISLNTTGQYEPYYAESSMLTKSNADTSVTETYAGTAAGFGMSRGGTIRDITRSDAGGKAAQAERGSTAIGQDKDWQ